MFDSTLIGCLKVNGLLRRVHHKRIGNEAQPRPQVTGVPASTAIVKFVCMLSGGGEGGGGGSRRIRANI